MQFVYHVMHPARAARGWFSALIIGTLVAALCWRTIAMFREHRHGWLATSLGVASVMGLVLVAGVLVGGALRARRKHKRAIWAGVGAGIALLGMWETLILGSYPLTSNEARLCFVALQAEARQPVGAEGRAVLRQAAALHGVRPELRRATTELALGVSGSDVESHLLRWCLH